MSKRFGFRPAQQRPAPQPQTQPPASAWSCVLSYDRDRPNSLRLEMLGGAQPPAEEVIAVLGLARDALLRQLGAALLQQEQAQQAQADSRTDDTERGVTAPGVGHA